MSFSAEDLETTDFDWGNAELTPQLLQAWRARMRRWCARELGGEFASRIDTSDVVQESLLQVWQDWDRFRGNSVGEVKAWMFRIARGHLHKARRHHRAAKRNVYTESATLVETSGDLQRDPSEQVARAEDRLHMMIAIDQLPTDLKEIVQRRIFGHQSFIEIGDAFGISRNEARNRYLRALRRLKVSLDGVLEDDLEHADSEHRESASPEIPPKAGPENSTPRVRSRDTTR